VGISITYTEAASAAFSFWPLRLKIIRALAAPILFGLMASVVGPAAWRYSPQIRRASSSF
jgi:hypothetical protein